MPVFLKNIMKTNKWIKILIKSFSLIFFLFSFLNTVAKGEDSLNKKFAINDPRNPDCPCHHYQKMADKEYRLLEEQEKNKHDVRKETKILIVNNSTLPPDKKVNHHNAYYSIFHLKDKSKKNKPLRKIHFKFNLKLFLLKPKTDKCYTWR